MTFSGAITQGRLKISRDILALLITGSSLEKLPCISQYRVLLRKVLKFYRLQAPVFLIIIAGTTYAQPLQNEHCLIEFQYKSIFCIKVIPSSGFLLPENIVCTTKVRQLKVIPLRYSLLCMHQSYPNQSICISQGIFLTSL